MPFITPGKTSNAIDRNASSPDRIRRNFQRITQGAATETLSVDGTTIEINADGQLAEAHPLTVNETPAGTIDGSNNTFTLSMAPFSGSLLLYVDGVLMLQGSDYTLATLTITFLAGAIPQAGDWIRATYKA